MVHALGQVVEVEERATRDDCLSCERGRWGSESAKDVFEAPSVVANEAVDGSLPLSVVVPG